MNAAPAVEAYVYYRVKPGCEAAAKQALLALCAALLARDRDWQLRWLVRSDHPDTGGAAPAPRPSTWMEIHTHPAGLDAARLRALDAAVARCGLDALLDGPRHTELFVPCAWP